MHDDLTAPPEDALDEDPKDREIRLLRVTVARLRGEILRMKCLQSWKDNPDQMGK